MGHNVIAFDIPHLQAFAADLSLLRLPVVDTLRLTPWRSLATCTTIW